MRNSQEGNEKCALFHLAIRENFVSPSWFADQRNEKSVTSSWRADTFPVEQLSSSGEYRETPTRLSLTVRMQNNRNNVSLVREWRAEKFHDL